MRGRRSTEHTDRDTHTQRQRGNTQVTHTQCVWCVKGHLSRAKPQRSRSKDRYWGAAARGQMLAAAGGGQRQHRNNTGVGRSITGVGIDNRAEVWNFFHTPPDRNGLVSISPCFSLCLSWLWLAEPEVLHLPFLHLRSAVAGRHRDHHQYHPWRPQPLLWRWCCAWGTPSCSAGRLVARLPRL